MDYSLQEYAKKIGVNEITVRRILKDPAKMVKKQISFTKAKTGIITIHTHNEPMAGKKPKARKLSSIKKRFLEGKIPIEEVKKILEGELFEILEVVTDPLDKLKVVDRIIMLERLDKKDVTPANEDVLKALTDAVNKIDFSGLTGEDK